MVMILKIQRPINWQKMRMHLLLIHIQHFDNQLIINNIHFLKKFLSPSDDLFPGLITNQRFVRE